MDDPQLSVTVTKPTTTVLGISGLPSPNLTLEPDNQITIGITAPRLPTGSNSPTLVTGLPRVDGFGTDS